MNGSRCLTLTLLVVTGCLFRQPTPMSSFPARAALNCYVPGPDDYAVTIVVHDTTFLDSAWLRPTLEDIYLELTA